VFSDSSIMLRILTGAAPAAAASHQQPSASWGSPESWRLPCLRPRCSSSNKVCDWQKLLQSQNTYN
jgi:invasion protein IalB